MEITFVKRQTIIDRYLDKINDGHQLTEEEIEFINDMSK